MAMSILLLVHILLTRCTAARFTYSSTTIHYLKRMRMRRRNRKRKKKKKVKRKGKGNVEREKS